MSHFSLLVIGKNPKKRLATFNENIASESCAKWDWYKLGGRWKGFFKLKDEAKEKYVDQALKKDIDFDFMVKKAGKNAEQRYKNIEKLLGGSIPKVDYLWKDLIDENGKFTHLLIEEKKEFYRSQSAMQKIAEAISNPNLSKKDESLLYRLDLEEYQISKPEFIKNAEDAALSTFAVLKDGKWHENGEMGGWGIVYNEKEQSEWNKEVKKLIESLPEETLLSVYDCHI